MAMLVYQRVTWGWNKQQNTEDSEDKVGMTLGIII